MILSCRKYLENINAIINILSLFTASRIIKKYLEFKCFNGIEHQSQLVETLTTRH